MIFVGLAKWQEKIQKSKAATPAKTDKGKEQGSNTGITNLPPATASTGTNNPPVQGDEPADVNVWHAKDIDVFPKEKLGAKRDRERNFLAVWHLDEGRLVQLSRESTEEVTPIKHQGLAYALNWTEYAMDRSIGRPAADLSVIDLATGVRKPVKKRIEDHYVMASPGGRYLLYVENDHYWTVDTGTLAVTNITQSLPVSFIDRESDWTIKQKPTFGVAGWTTNDEAVILYDKFDLWQIAADGSRATRLTEGRSEEIRHRYQQTDPEEEWIDRDKPIYLHLFGIWTKRSGYARLRPATDTVERLVFLDKSIEKLAKAKEADVYAYVAEGFDDSPDAFIAGPELKQAKQVTATNPFQSGFAWGHEELIDYKSEHNERLQGGLFYPADYEPGRRYPMIVYVYERLSDRIHSYRPPSERDPYNPSVFTSLGYFVLNPDIAFRAREPGLSVVECVGAAVKKVCEMGVADPKRIGVVGHSWGGFDTTFLAAQTELFSAAVAGAPITDLVSNYGNHHWSIGIAETDHIETGQQRMEVPLWEDLPAYIRNSAVFHVQNMKTPLLIEVGDDDGTVFWHQGVEMYNIARRARRNLVMLVYPGEDHGLHKKANQMDYHHRIIEWFGHYLKDEPVRPWIASGVSYLEREQELKRLKAQKSE